VRFHAASFQHVRWYVGSRDVTRAIAWHGASVSDNPLHADEMLAVPAGAARTVDMVPDDAGELRVHAGIDAEFVVALQVPALDGAKRRLDGIDVSLCHRHWGMAGSSFWRRIAEPNLVALPAVDDVVAFLMRSSPSIGTRRRPLVSQLLSAYINFLVADMVELDGAEQHECAGDTCYAASRTAPSVTRSAAALRAGAMRAGGRDDFDRAALERDPLPALVNLQTHWIDGSQIYGTSVEANRRLRTLSGGQLSTDVARWPLRFASIQAVAVADLFVREHNRRAAALASANRSLSDEQLFLGARRLVVASMQRIAIDEMLPSLIGDVLPPYVHEPDTRGDVAATFALACAPALMLGGTPARVELLNANLAPIYASANGGDAEGSADASTLSTDACSGSPSNAASCLAFGVEALVRGLFVAVAPAIDSSVGDHFQSLRVGNESLRRQTPLVDAPTEWVLRGRAALLPTFAQLLRDRGATVPATMAELVGLEPGANLTALVERAYRAAPRGSLFDERPLVARTLEQLYPGGVEQIDAIVGLMVEPSDTPLSSSVGPTLADCVRTQLTFTRNADRLWFQNNDVVALDELMPGRSEGGKAASFSLLRHLLVLNYDFKDKAAGSVHAMGTLAVPAGLEAARDAVTRFVSSIATFQGGAARAVRLGFHAGGTYESSSMRYGFAQGDCFARSIAQSDPANRGFERVPLELMQLRNSADGALFANMSNADLLSLIGAVGVTTASRGGLAMVWRRGRTDLGATLQEASVCPMHGKLPDALVSGDDTFPHTRTLDAIRAKFQRQGFNDRELVALLGAHSLGGLHESLSGFPNGVWTLRSDTCDNTYFRNLLAFASPSNRLLVRSTADPSKFAYRLAAGASSGEIGVIMLPSDVALLGSATMREWVERYAADNALFQRDFARSFQRMLENGAAGVGAPLEPLPATMDGESDDATAAPRNESELNADALGAPPELPFYAARSQQSTTFVFLSEPPVGVNGRAWQSITQPLPALRVSSVADDDFVHVLLETPTDSYVGLGFGPRAPGASMRGADVLIVALNPDGTPLVRDAYSQSDQLPPTPDVALNGSGSAWFNVHAERIGGMSRFWLSRARSTGDEWDNDVPPSGLVETLFALGSVSLLDGDMEDVLSTYHGAQRAVIRMEWPVSRDEQSTVVPRELAPSEDALPVVEIVLGAVAGALVLLIVAVLCAFYFVRRTRARPHFRRRRGDADRR
jgi:cytochrome c peroxidase